MGERARQLRIAESTGKRLQEFATKNNMSLWGLVEVLALHAEEAPVDWSRYAIIFPSSQVQAANRWNEMIELVAETLRMGPTTKQDLIDLYELTEAQATRILNSLAPNPALKRLKGGRYQLIP